VSLTTVDGSLISSGAITLTTQVTGTLPVANGGSGVTTSTGTGANVLGTSPTLTTPVFDSATFATVSGTAPIYGCRAWCRFNGTTTGTNAPTAGGNVSTVTRNGAGDYTINFTTAMPDANYSVSGSVQLDTITNNSDGAFQIKRGVATPLTTTTARIGTGSYNLTNADCVIVCVAIFR
jgi:hypothetical protein